MNDVIRQEFEEIAEEAIVSAEEGDFVDGLKMLRDAINARYESAKDEAGSDDE